MYRYQKVSRLYSSRPKTSSIRDARKNKCVCWIIMKIQFALLQNRGENRIKNIPRRDVADEEKKELEERKQVSFIVEKKDFSVIH